MVFNHIFHKKTYFFLWEITFHYIRSVFRLKEKKINLINKNLRGYLRNIELTIMFFHDKIPDV